MPERRLRPIVTTGVVVALTILAAGDAVAQSSGKGGSSAGGSAPTGEGGGGGRPVIVCTGCADPNTYIEDGKVVGGAKERLVITHRPGPNGPERIPRRPPRARPHTNESETCHRSYRYLPDGGLLIYRECNGIVRPLR